MQLEIKAIKLFNPSHLTLKVRWIKISAIYIFNLKICYKNNFTPPPIAEQGLRSYYPASFLLEIELEIEIEIEIKLKL